MKFVCDRCQTKYSIADERVRGKVLKVKCKSCANVITVREARSPSSAVPTLSGGGGARARSGAAAALSVPHETPAIDSERTQLAMSPFGAESEGFPDLLAPAAPPPAPVRRPSAPLGSLGGTDELVQWYMALDGNRSGPFTRSKLVDRLLPLAKTADVHIWNEKLDGWKPPSQVPEVAGEIARRRVPAPPVPAPVRRPTPPPMPPIASLGAPAGPPHGQPRKPTGPHAPPSPLAHAAGPAPSKLPPPGGVHPALAARAAEHSNAEAASLLETPAPMPHQLPHPAQKTNGVHGHAPPKPVNSDVMQMLNLPGGAQTAPGAPPRLMSSTDALGWRPTTDAKGRNKTTALILGLLVVIGAIVTVAFISLKKPARPAPVAVVKPPEPPPPEKVAAPEPPPAPPVQPPPPEPPQKGKGKLRGKQGKLAAGKNAGGTTTTGGATTTQQQGTEPTGDAARFADNHKMNITGGGVASRPPPSQSDIMKVIGNNRANIKVCYQRALTRDNSLTHGKLSVKLSIGISGRVKHVGLEGPTQFRLLLEPCIKDVVQRWVFPQASEEYGTEFPLVFQGNE